MKKRIPLILIFILLVLVGNQLVSPDRVASLRAVYEQSPLLFIGAYILLYWVLAVIGVPGMAVLTILAGTLLGRWPGFLLAIITVGSAAVLSFLTARYLFRDFIEKHFPKEVQKVREHMESNGCSYLFTLRMIPGIPFALLNFSFGVSAMPLFDYWWVSQLGLIPITFLLVNAGAQLSTVSSLHELFTSPAVILSFVALALLPYGLKWIIARISKK